MPNLPNRRSIRLKGYDYSQEGLYFLTLCCQDRICRFGKVIKGEMVLNEVGKIAEQCWLQIPEHFPNVILHKYVIMPNHIHGIIEIAQSKIRPSDETVGAKDFSPENQAKDIRAKDFSPQPKDFSPQRGTAKTVGSIIRGFKIGVTKWVRQNTNIHQIWQRDYYEHIIRDERAYNNISRYIQNNPLNWDEDKFYH